MPKTTAVFRKLYKALNEAQKKAVDTVEGPVMVIAGPGTGKTHVLTLRIANILVRTDADPENILALTFTDSAAKHMRRRLAEIMGPAAYRVTIQTFHSFCNDIITDRPEHFPRIVGSTPATEVEQVRILQKVIDSLNLKLLRPFGEPYYYVRAARSAIDELKRDAVTPKELSGRVEAGEKTFEARDDLYHTKGAHKGKMKAAYVREKQFIEKNKELSRIYASYEKELASRRLYDYADMILEAVSALKKDEDLKRTFQERYQYLLADEHQDANKAQNALLELLSDYHENPNLFLVGDDQQAIFRFQGASLENFLYFKKRYAGAEKIELTVSYRSTQRVLDSSHSLVEAGQNEMNRSPLRSAHRVKGEGIRVYEFSRDEAEAYGVASLIKEEIGRGVSPEDVGVLYRDNRDAFPVAHMLEKLGVPYVIESDQNTLEDPHVKSLMHLLRAVQHFGDDASLVPVLHIDFLGLDPLDVYGHIAKSAPRRNPLWKMIKGQKGALGELYEKLASWKKAATSEPLTVFVERVIRESGLLEHILKGGEAYEELERLGAFFGEVRSLVTSRPDAELPDFIRHVGAMAEHGISISYRPTLRREGSVRLMTAHRAKGQEFTAVYIVGAYDGHWGNRRRAQYFSLPLKEGEGSPMANIEDERRLFYVALTRAKERVTVSFSSAGPDGRERVPAQFIGEIKKEYVAHGASSEYEEAYSQNQSILFAAPAAEIIDLKEGAFVRSLFKERGLSVTALNNYLKCPWEYFYVSLLRVPRAISVHQLYGIAVHRALSALFKALEAGEDAGEKTLIASFEREIARMPLSSADREAFTRRGKEALVGWYGVRSGSWVEPSIAPMRIAGVEFKDGLVLRGEIDRLEVVGEKGESRVIDYKTARPRSRAAIKGKTKNSDADYWRQLVFYALLLRLYEDGKYRAKTGVVDFVEPNPSGAYKKEEFEILDADVVELEDEIRRVAGEITSLAFWDRRCERAECEYCALRESLVQQRA